MPDFSNPAWWRTPLPEASQWHYGTAGDQFRRPGPSGSWTRRRTTRWRTRPWTRRTRRWGRATRRPQWRSRSASPRSKAWQGKSSISTISRLIGVSFGAFSNSSPAVCSPSVICVCAQRGRPRGLPGPGLSRGRGSSGLQEPPEHLLLRGLHVPGSFSKVKWWRRLSFNYGTQREDWVLPNKNKTEDGEKKQKLTTKKTKNEKDFLLLGSNLLVEVLYLETKVAGMFSYSIFFRGYALSIDAFL